jgi:hypothetical protein
VSDIVDVGAQTEYLCEQVLGGWLSSSRVGPSGTTQPEPCPLMFETSCPAYRPSAILRARSTSGRVRETVRRRMVVGRVHEYLRGSSWAAEHGERDVFRFLRRGTGRA